MDDKKWEKFAALGGVAFVVLNVVGTVLQGSPPSDADNNDEVLEWFVDTDTGLKAASFLAVLSIIGLAWWFGSLWRRMTNAENNDLELHGPDWVVRVARFPHLDDLDPGCELPHVAHR